MATGVHPARARGGGPAPSGPLVRESRDDPRYRVLPRRVLRVWQVEAVLGGVALAAVAGAVLAAPFTPASWDRWGQVGLGAVLALAVLEALVVVPRRHRGYRWAVLEDCVVVVQGQVFVRRTVLPVRQVLYVETRRGPLLRRCGLATVHLGSLAEPHAVGPLPLDDAEWVQRAVRAHHGGPGA